MISLIITVKNEKNNLPVWLASIEAQSLRPDEIIVVDAGSNDGTWAWLQQQASERIKVFQKSGNIATGRNYAIVEARGEIIVVTDAGCIYDKTWFEQIALPIKRGDTQFVATAFAPWFDETDSLLVYAIAAATIPQKEEFKSNWLPSSRSVAFTKDLWHSVGGYPEWIPYCEDVIFDQKLIDKIGLPMFVREPLVLWRPRTNLKKFYQQLYNYTRSEGHGKLNGIRQVIRYAVYLLAIIGCTLAFEKSIFYLLPIFIGGSLYAYKFVRRWFSFAVKKNFFSRVIGMFAVLPIVAIGDGAKMVGYVVGTIERILGKVTEYKI